MAKHKKKTKFKYNKYTLMAIAAIVLIGIIVLTFVPGGVLAKFSAPQQLSLRSSCTYVVLTSDSENGNTVCLRKGYTTCVAAFRSRQTLYYSSVDNSCRGQLQAEDRSTDIFSCQQVFQVERTCENRAAEAEPFNGDIFTNIPACTVICCR